ncbi:IQ domain-containing protein E-like isoform X2 [Lineus longissimus]|uniref:IQ domain-containing protein E-like isoform X2 n=1 Tax=Lineus longissimus TaxID=88925 RepID=UPI00315D2154
MKRHEKDDYDDDFESEGENDVIVVKTKKKPRAVSATAGRMQSGRKSATLPARKSGSGVNKARASGSRKSPRELWLSSVKNGGGGLSTGRKLGSSGNRTSMDYWMDALRKTGEGRSTNSTRMNTFSGQRPEHADMPYMSTSHYLRQMVGGEKGKKSAGDSPGGKGPGRRPAYKSQEEYYDEILDLKKHIVTVNNENTHMKSKLRRVEEDNAKKDKEIEQLLNPSKSEDLRRTLGDRKPDSGAVIHSLKQKVLKLEQQLKEKEAAHKKLQSDIKATKIEETKIQVEAFYAEIVRLQSMAPSKSSSSSKPQTKDTSVKLKALNETVLRLNESNSRLQLENKALKEDLSRQLEQTSKEKEQVAQGYRDMNKRELMGAITKLEKRLEKAEGDTVSILSGLESRQGDHQGKMVLEGSVAQRLDQLDKRETELLEENEKLGSTVKKLKEDKNHYKRRSDEKDKEIKALRKEVEDLRSQLEAAYADPDRTGRKAHKSPQKRPTSSRASTTGSVETVARARRMSDESVGSRRSHRQSPDIIAQRRREADDEADRQQRIEEFEKKRAAKAIQRSWKGHKKTKDEQEEQQQHQRKVEEFTSNHAARQIQKQWRGHQESDATTLIQSTLRGHKTRKDQLRNLQFAGDSDDTEEIDDAAVLIQSAYRGHNTRKGQLKRTSSPISSKGSRPSSAKRGGSSVPALDSEGESIDDDSTYSGSLMSSARSYPSKSASRGRPTSPKPGVRTSPFRRSPALLKDNDDDDDDDDDIIF